MYLQDVIELLQQMLLGGLLTGQSWTAEHAGHTLPDWAAVAMMLGCVSVAFGACYVLGGKTVSGTLLAFAVTAGLTLPAVLCFADAPALAVLCAVSGPVAVALTCGAHQRGWARWTARLIWPAATLLAVFTVPEASVGAVASSLLAWTIGWAGRVALPFSEERSHGTL